MTRRKFMTAIAGVGAMLAWPFKARGKQEPQYRPTYTLKSDAAKRFIARSPFVKTTLVHDGNRWRWIIVNGPPGMIIEIED